MDILDLGEYVLDIMGEAAVYTDVQVKMAVPFCRFVFSLAMHESFFFFTFLSVLRIFSLLNYSHPSRLVGIFYLDFNLLLSYNLKQSFICFFAIFFFFW